MWGFFEKPLTADQARTAFYEAIREHPDNRTVALAVTKKIPLFHPLRSWAQNVRKSYRQMERHFDPEARRKMYDSYREIAEESHLSPHLAR
jgi:hypothetical protein